MAEVLPAPTAPFVLTPLASGSVAHAAGVAADFEFLAAKRVRWAE